MRKIYQLFCLLIITQISAQEWETVVLLPGSSPIKQIEVVNDQNIYVSSQYYKLYNWNGTEWNGVGNFNPGFNGVFEYKSDTEIYATHNTYINSNNPNEYNYIAKWNGTSWSNFGNFNQAKHIYNFKIINDNEAYAVGAFDDLDGYRWRSVAKYNGTSWHVVGLGDTNAGTYSGNNSLWVNNANDIYSKWDSYRSNGNKFVKRWDGTSWTILSNGNLDEIYNVDRIHVVSENEIYTNAWNKEVDFGVIGYWDGDYWKILGDIQTDLNTGGYYGSLDFVFVNSNEIYAFGSALRNRTDFTYQVAVWNGVKWHPLGDLKANKPVTAGFYKDGFLYVGGSFTISGKTLIRKIDAKKILSNSDFSLNKSPKITPNPVVNSCNLNKNYQKIKVLNTSGQLIFSANNTDKIEVSTIKKGVYILQLEDKNNNVYYKKMIKA